MRERTQIVVSNTKDKRAKDNCSNNNSKLRRLNESL